MPTPRTRLVLALHLGCSLALAACHHHGGGIDYDLGDDASATDDLSSGGDMVTPPPPDLAPGELDVEPSALQTITVAAGASTPTVAYAATIDGLPVSAAWTIDRGDIAELPSDTGPNVSFTPRGTVGGLVTLTAGFNGQTVSRQVLVKITASQNGVNLSIPSEAAQIPGNTAALTAGGGVGGVGGEGLGPAVTDPATLTALSNPAGNGSTQGLTFLYPYNNTVWPRGLLAPLLMWRWMTNDADAVQVTLKTTSGSYSWTGSFGRPAILATTMGPFIRMPIPQDVWAAATQSAGGPMPGGGTDQLTVGITVAKSGVAYGPISETWGVAAGLLSGIVYYNSYGTQLVTNYSGAVGGNHLFGGASLSIHVGDSGPQLAAGSNSTPPDISGCRVCHSVAANGSRLVVQKGDSSGDLVSFAYDITPAGLNPNQLTHNATFSGLYPDGSQTLTYGGLLLPLDVDTTPTTTTGLISTMLGTPVFSPDGSHVAFNPQDSTLGGGQKLYVMGFDNTTKAFSGAIVVDDDTGAASSAVRPGWAAFLPDSKSLVFQHQVTLGIDDPHTGVLDTRANSAAQIAWTNVTDSAHVTTLNQLNGLDSTGTSYLPSLPAPVTLACNDAAGNQVGGTNDDHSDDVHMNYEPTVNPVASGGYAWVIFTSRRMYGNEITIPPFCSDPRGVDLIDNITPKKLWVAAIDLNAAPGTDASHPAFYLPAQELLAGNSRAFWVLDPCRADGTSCDSGDECCNGYCEADGSDGGLICSNAPPQGQCSAVGDKCTTAANCCDPTNQCVNGFCTIANPPIQ